MIEFTQKGNLSKIDNYFEHLKEKIGLSRLDKYGKEGVEALRVATPKRTGLTADSWYYKIERTNGSVALNFYNSNIQDGVQVAIILQYGHATRNGGWVEGIDYINETLSPIFNKIAKKAWEEVTK